MEALSKAEAFVLHWLSNEDFSHLGECNGPALRRLRDLELAKVEHEERGDYAHVSLTERGWELCKAYS